MMVKVGGSEVRINAGYAASGEHVVLHLGDVEVWLPWRQALAVGQQGRRCQRSEAGLARRIKCLRAQRRHRRVR